jgi:hypothetical protein
MQVSKVLPKIFRILFLVLFVLAAISFRRNRQPALNIFRGNQETL